MPFCSRKTFTTATKNLVSRYLIYTVSPANISVLDTKRTVIPTKEQVLNR